MRTAITILLPILLAACAATSRHEAASVHGPVVYSCDDGLTLSVRFTREHAEVTLPSGEQLSLPQQPSGSGIAYGTAQSELRGKGDEATWTSGRRAPVGCRVRP